jgi:hypothetical protein
MRIVTLRYSWNPNGKENGGEPKTCETYEEEFFCPVPTDNPGENEE